MNAHILIVDDNDTGRKIFVRLLRKMPIDITQASGGQQAVELASFTHFDIIFMDHFMPGMDGITAMKLIKDDKNGPNADTPIVALTGNEDEGLEQMYLNEGFDGYIEKPIEMSKLNRLLKEMLPEGCVVFDTEESDKEAPKYTENDFPAIYGIDWDVAMMRLKDKKTVDQILGDFVNTVDAQTAELQFYKDNLPGKLDDYRILVHGTKSVAASLGICVLTGMSAVLEKAASKKDIDTIEKIHDVFIREWKDYKDRLAEYLHAGEPKEDEKEKLNEVILDMLLSMLKTAMEEMDVAVADKTISKMAYYKLPDYVSEHFEELKSAVSLLDQKKALQILAQME